MLQVDVDMVTIQGQRMVWIFVFQREKRQFFNTLIQVL